MDHVHINPEVCAPLDRRTLIALVEASHAINTDIDLVTIFVRIAEQTASVLSAEGASVLILDEHHDELEFKAVTGPGAAKLNGMRVRTDQGIAGQVFRTRRPVRVDDVKQNNHFFDGIDALTSMQTRSIMAAPLIHHDNVLGVVEVVNPKSRPLFTDADLELLRVLANLAAAATQTAKDLDRMKRQNLGLRTTGRPSAPVGSCPAFQEMMDLCRKVATVPTTVLITGETGTGKEMAARTIHRHSVRKDQPFIAVNCAALPESLLESELFGHEKGAFTGAVDRKLGRFELADGGTLFLDEVGEISAGGQTKLLRVLQEKEFTRVGGTKTINCDVRIVAATNRDLLAEVEAGRFRQDLYYRLNIFPIHIPPLRDRLQDISALVDHTIQQFAPTFGVSPPRVSLEALSAMQVYHWPGNIRELRNVMERCTLLAGAQIEIHHLPPEISKAVTGTRNGGTQQTDRWQPSGNVAQLQSVGDAEPPNQLKPEIVTPITQVLADHERAMLVKTLCEINWNQSAAARKLGISRDLLRYRIKKHGIKKPVKQPQEAPQP